MTTFKQAFLSLYDYYIALNEAEFTITCHNKYQILKKDGPYKQKKINAKTYKRH